MKKFALLFLLGAVVGCGNFAVDSESASLVFDTLLSGCGGLNNDKKNDVFSTREQREYCDAELLHWSFDDETGRITILNARILLNCCGEHEITAERLDDGTYSITEVDLPELVEGGERSRCHCVCVFDYQITIENIHDEKIKILLVRDVEENSDIETVFQGELDLSEGSGSVVIDETDLTGICEPDV